MKHKELIFGIIISVLAIFVLFSVTSRLPDRKSSGYVKDTGRKLEGIGFKKNRKTLIGVIGSYSSTQGEKAEQLSEKDLVIEKITVRTYRHTRDSVLYENENGSKIAFSVLKNFTNGKKEMLLYERLYSLMGYETAGKGESYLFMYSKEKKPVHLVCLKDKVIVNADITGYNTDEILKILDSEK